MPSRSRAPSRRRSATGDKGTQVEGMADKAAGKAQKTYGDAKQKIKDSL
ncbi:CsbD family protein [Aquamicrobium terrae]